MPYSPHSETKPSPSAPNTGAIDPLNGTLSPPKTGHFIYKPYRALKPSPTVKDDASTDTQSNYTRSNDLVNASHARAGTRFPVSSFAPPQAILTPWSRRRRLDVLCADKRKGTFLVNPLTVGVLTLTVRKSF
jgi:hypothetical protein